MKRILLSPKEKRIVEKLVDMLAEYDNEVTLSLMKIDFTYVEEEEINDLFFLLEDYYWIQKYGRQTLKGKVFEYKGELYEIYEAKTLRTRDLILRKVKRTSELDKLNILES